ncbi:MAG: MBL fold metallo-hydrolase [Marinifilaceae bacterium]|jgi:glyoxylase-like metal-dependent hydrolase (beta-lactamase superfamily II)
MHTLLSHHKIRKERKLLGAEILPLQMGTSKAFLIINGANSILVDAGNKNKEDKVFEAMDRFLLPPESLRLIVITHTHFDHCGSLRRIQKRTGAKILVHSEEARYLRNGYSPIPKGTFFLSRWISYLGQKLFPGIAAFPKVKPDIIIQEKYDLEKFGLRAYILPTPGHTAGSCSLIIEDKYAIVGDTLFGMFPPSVYPPFANNQEEMIRSWKLLLDSGCRRFLPAHGSPISREELLEAYGKYQGQIPIE